MDNNLDITIKELYLPSKNEKNTYLCENFIVYPEDKEKNGGYLMGMIELRATPVNESEKIIQTIINSLKESYYNQIKTSPEPQKLNLETVFEYALQKTNSALTELIQIGHINLILENLHYVIAVSKPNPKTKDIDFVFTHQGLIQVHLLHKTKQNNYKVINIVDNTPKIKEEQTEKLKIFSSTLCGKIFNHNLLYFCSEIFNNYIPAHKVNKIISNNDLNNAVNYFKNLIHNVKNNAQLTYSAVFLKMEEKRSPSEHPVSQKSINNLLNTKEKTEKFLTPNFSINVQDYLSKIFSWIKLKNNNHKKLKIAKNEQKLKFGILKYIFNIFKIGFDSLTKLFTFSFKHNPDKMKTKQSSDKTSLVKKFNQHRKLVIIVTLVFVIVIISAIFWFNYQKQNKIEQANYAMEVKKAKDLINNAQINLIYQNENKSLEYVKQAEEVINYLPQATTDQQANFNELKKQNDTIKNKLLHITKLTPQLVVEFTNQEQKPTLQTLIKQSSNLVAGTVGNQIYQYNLDNNEAKQPATSNLGDINTSFFEDDKIYFLTNQSKLLKYNSTDQSTKQVSIAWGDNASLTDIKSYNGNLYALDKTNQQIYRWKSDGDAFGSRQPWLKDKKDADLSSASSLTIDGNIFTINQNGQIYKFFTGTKEDFDSPTIEPALTNVQKIYTDSDEGNLYILENNSKRLIIINKQGKFETQYLFETLTEPISDFTVDRTTLYLISENKIYKAEL